ncbi:MAG TPA: zf-HC2 domain-containing protein [Pyrinomonadaceae bacterium]|nr:zf-HC2 domain-containing protein [Pyrinomonadaceae bacterium]
MPEGAKPGAQCPQTTLTAAYLDGELDARSSEEFEGHARSCPRCSAALLEQRRLLCLLDGIFDQTFEKRVALPANFTRELRARAQNDMSGVRGRGERRLALKICAALGLAAFALLGFAALDAALSPALGAARAAGGALAVAGRAATGAGEGAGLVLHAVGAGLTERAVSPALLLLAAPAAALVLLLRLIGAYHRERTRD